MQLVLQVVQRLLPQGTNRSALGIETIGALPAPDWRLPPLWPPDMFAVAATLISLSGCYSRNDIGGGLDDTRARQNYQERIARLGYVWAMGQTWPGFPGKGGMRAGSDEHARDELVADLCGLWTILLAAGHEPVSAELDGELPTWCGSALELLAIADEASSGLGYGENTLLSARTALWHWSAHVFKETNTPRSDATRRRRTATICDLVPPEVCCVQPKARTPQVGCTLRSLSSNLALLPPIGEVLTRYLVSPGELDVPRSDAKIPAQLNMLLVPYPYSFADDECQPAARHPEEGWGTFEIRQSWLKRREGEPLPQFLEKIAAAACKDGPGVDAMILPEISLDRKGADAIAHHLAQKTQIKLLVTGVAEQVDGRSRNQVASYLLDAQQVLGGWRQSKHHRWCVEKSQINGYGFQLDPNLIWWEHIDVAGRELTFYQLRKSAALLATLICEDLARVEPVLPIVRAVGPNLVIALLLDGAQKHVRWPGISAAQLADDPGSSVLTLTSLAPVARAMAAGNDTGTEYPIALWKDNGSHSRTLNLAKGAHALLLRLNLTMRRESTIDGRSDFGSTLQITYESHHQVTAPVAADADGWPAIAGVFSSASDVISMDVGPEGYPTQSALFDQRARAAVNHAKARNDRLEQHMKRLHMVASATRKL